MSEAPTNFHRHPQRTQNGNWSVPPKDITHCCHSPRAECIRFKNSSRCCSDYASPIPVCKDRMWDHCHLSQPQSPCHSQRKELHLPPSVLGREYGYVPRYTHCCDCNICCHCCGEETRTSRICCSTCYQCPVCLNKCSSIHHTQRFFKNGRHSVCCDFHHCGQQGKAK